MKQQNQQPTQEKTESKSPTKTNWKFITIVLALGLLVVGGLGILMWQQGNIEQEKQSFQESMANQETPQGLMRQEIEKDWIGVIATNDGLIKINPQRLKEGSDIVQHPVLPPGMPSNYFKGLTAYDDVKRARLLDLLSDGRFLFVGASEMQALPRRNMIYAWSIESADEPKPFLELPEEQKIIVFAVSPDMKEVGVISVSKDEEEMFKGLEGLLREELKKVFTERQLERNEQLATITIYEVGTNKVANTLKWKTPRTGEEGQSEDITLLWNNVGIFVFPRYEENILLDAQSGKLITTFEGSVSPDGSKYFQNLTIIKRIPDHAILSQLRIPEADIRSLQEEFNEETRSIFPLGIAFSPDSRRALSVSGSVGGDYFIMWEIDVEGNSTRKIGDLYTLLNFEEQRRSPDLRAYYFPFITYHPSGNAILFTLFSDIESVQRGRGIKSIIDLFWLELSDTQKAQLIPISFEFPNFLNIRDISFLGWYLSQ